MIIEEVEHTTRRGTTPTPSTTTTSNGQTLSESLTRRRNTTGDMTFYRSGTRRPVSEDRDQDESTDTTATTSEATQTPSDDTSAEIEWEDGAKGSGACDKGKGEVKELSAVADKGNRLSQIEVPTEMDGNAISVVDVSYDL